MQLVPDYSFLETAISVAHLGTGQSWHQPTAPTLGIVHTLGNSVAAQVTAQPCNEMCPSPTSMGRTLLLSVGFWTQFFLHHLTCGSPLEPWSSGEKHNGES